MRKSGARTALAVLILGACDGAGVTEEPRAVAAVDVTPAEAVVVRGGTMDFDARVTDADGRVLADREIAWATSEPRYVLPFDESAGTFIGVELGGPVNVQAYVEGVTGSAELSVVTTGSAVVDDVLSGLGRFVSSMIDLNQAGLALNPTLVEHIQAKIDLLQRPELTTEIVVRRRYISDVLATNARELPIVVVYPADTMRTGAQSSVEQVRSALPLLEAFVQTPLPESRIVIWYGFGLGSRGGGGVLNMEDRGTFQSSRNAAVPYDAIVMHELSHSYIGHEPLNQFLELYQYNVVRTGSIDVADWLFTRGYVPDRAENAGVRAALDIYRIIGHDAMSDVYRELHVLRPGYGQPLSPAARAAILERAPAGREADVALKVERLDGV